MSVQVANLDLAINVAKFIASYPKCPPGFFVGRYHHFKFDWLPYLRLTRLGGSPFGSGFADAITTIFVDEDPKVMGMFFRAICEATMRGEGYRFMLDTFGPYPTITLREARENAGMSERGAAKAAQIDVRTLRRWEQNGAHKADAFKFLRLLKVFCVSIDRINLEPVNGAKRVPRNDLLQVKKR